jgi:putative ATP-dependent endonuclease of OLD family
MKLLSFSAQNYRSITKASLTLQDMTILIGPNNEGKSNILRALVLALAILSARRPQVIRGRLLLPSSVARDYVWERDYPVNLQEAKPYGESVFQLEFELTAKDIRDFKKSVGSQINPNLRLQISLGKDQVPRFRVLKQGRAGLSEKRSAIAAFISDELDFQYIPAVRTADSAERVVETLVARALEKVESDERYAEALRAIETAQAPVLASLSATIRDSLAVFLPEVRRADVTISRESRSAALRSSCDILIDDGTPTLLRYKGDGVQSLAALSLMRHASQLGAGERHLILAVEEPESHLHPSAIHRLRAVLQEISQSNQIILTTHCPILVDRAHIQANVIVTGNRAVPANTVREIRDILGVQVADNLTHAELVLLVEGPSDVTALDALLRHASPLLRSCLDSTRLVVSPVGGAGSLKYRLAQTRDAMCMLHVFLDDDAPGRAAADAAMRDALACQADITFSVCDGMSEAEFEDMLDPDLYADWIRGSYGVELNVACLKANTKWSTRMRDAFRRHGKQWSERVERDLKEGLAQRVSQNPASALNAHKRSSFDSLVKTLERMLERQS